MPAVSGPKPKKSRGGEKAQGLLCKVTRGQQQQVSYNLGTCTTTDYYYYYYFYCYYYDYYYDCDYVF
jgi:hypothetical protein